MRAATVYKKLITTGQECGDIRDFPTRPYKTLRIKRLGVEWGAIVACRMVLADVDANASYSGASLTRLSDAALCRAALTTASDRNASSNWEVCRTRLVTAR